MQQTMRDIDASIQVLKVEIAAEKLVSAREVALRGQAPHCVDVANMTGGASAGPRSKLGRGQAHLWEGMAGAALTSQNAASRGLIALEPVDLDTG